MVQPGLEQAERAEAQVTGRTEFPRPEGPKQNIGSNPARFPYGAHNFSEAECQTAYEFLDKFLK